MKKLVLHSLALTLLAWAGAASVQAATTTVYDNTATTGLGAYTPGGATAANPTTDIVADDIDFVSGAAGLQIGSVTFTVYNLNNAATTFVPNLVFYQTDGSNGGPGTLLTQISLTPITLASGTFTQYTFASATGFFAIPANDSIWAGIYYTGATAGELNNINDIFHDPPSVGTSSDRLFVSSGPGTAGSNPAGTIGGGLSMAFAFGALGTAVPEPSTWAMFGAGVVGVGFVALRRRRVVA